MTGRWFFQSAWVLLPSMGVAQGADNCEPLRAQIEAHIVGKGVSGVALKVVPAGTAAPGGVVMACDNGRKKIVHTQVAAPAPVAAPASTPPAAKPVSPKRPTRDDEIWTECKDGTVVRGGRCKH
jgi:hypothetical protein